MSFSKLPKYIKNNIFFKTSEKMDEIKDGEIQAVITSPPYWDLKDYEHSEQIGFGESYVKYHERLDRVWSECRRVLKDNGTMWIVIDKLWRDREVLNIPLHIAQHCTEIGFHLTDMIIWNKPTAIAGMNDRNLVNKYETILFLSKIKSGYKFNLEKIREPIKPDYVTGGQLSDFWRFVVKAGSIRNTPDHKAPYPRELIERIVRLSTDEGDTILDPFLGSGTTAMVAYGLKRKCIGYEINPQFSKVIANQLVSYLKYPKLDLYISTRKQNV